MNNSRQTEEFLNIEGPNDESLFNRLLIWCLPPDWMQSLQLELDNVFTNLGSTDDRALAVVGALILENAIDELLGAHIPGYKKIQDNPAFSFSVKINLARSLKLCPARLFGAADTIRLIRNDFAHSLSISVFQECKTSHLQSLNGHLHQINSGLAEVETPREQFRNLVSMVFLSLHGYKHHVQRLNQFVHNPSAFRKHFRQYCEENYTQPQQGTHFE